MRTTITSTGRLKPPRDISFVARTLQRARLAALLALALGAAACGLESQEAPSLIGPSGFGQAVTLSAVPDSLPKDGSSQSVITITVRDDQGRPVSGQRLTLGTTGGTLSQGEVVTTSDGRATFSVTAPQLSTPTQGNEIVVSATPVGNNALNSVTRILSIALTGLSNTTAPSPQFTMAPAAPRAQEVVTFDASGTTDEGSTCGNACTYSWSFGEGTTKTGRIVTHTFASAGTYTITLTVTDAAGTTASRQQTVTVTTVPAPTITSITVAPNPPLAGQTATFTAVVSPASGHAITSFVWNFGDGSNQTTTTPSVSHIYRTQGVYVVTLTVTQDTGQTASLSQQVNVSNSAVNATISFSPTNPFIGQAVSFVALNPTAPNGASIASFEWNFGDAASGSANTATGQSVTHTFASANTFVVRLTLTDSNGIVGVITTTVTVTDPTAN